MNGLRCLQRENKKVYLAEAIPGGTITMRESASPGTEGYLWETILTDNETQDYLAHLEAIGYEIEFTKYGMIAVDRAFLDTKVVDIFVYVWFGVERLNAYPRMRPLFGVPWPPRSQEGE